MKSFKYSKREYQMILRNEEETLKIYTQIISEYIEKFKEHGYSLNLNRYWVNKIKSQRSFSRLPFRNGYGFYIWCKVVPEEYNKCKYCELSITHNISSITGIPFFLKIKIDRDANSFINNLERMLLMIEES